MMRKATAAAAMVALMMTAGSSLPASAGNAEKVRRGSCSGAAHWKLKVKPDNGRLEVQAEVDSNVTGQTWHWKIRHNGSVSARGSATTTGPSGSFEVKRRMTNLSGADRFRLRAVHQGQVCRGRIRW